MDMDFGMWFAAVFVGSAFCYLFLEVWIKVYKGVGIVFNGVRNYIKLSYF